MEGHHPKKPLDKSERSQHGLPKECQLIEVWDRRRLSKRRVRASMQMA
jgi:hypothetical protein